MAWDPPSLGFIPVSICCWKLSINNNEQKISVNLKFFINNVRWKHSPRCYHDSVPGHDTSAICRHFVDIFKYKFFRQFLNPISLKLVPGSPIESALVQAMTRHRLEDKQLPERMKTDFTDAYMRHWTPMSWLIGDSDIWRHSLGQHWLRKWLVACRHQAISLTNIDLSSKVFCGIHLRTISQDVPMNLIRYMSSKITVIKLLVHLPGANELRYRRECTDIMTHAIFHNFYY